MQVKAKYLSKTYPKAKQRLVIGTLFSKLNLTVKRAKVLNFNLAGIGTIRSHGNNKRLSKLKYVKKYNKKLWKQKKKVNNFFEQTLLY